MSVTIQREMEAIEKRLGFLATVGANATFVGLFGTVWGIMEAFTKIQESGKADLGSVAGPIGEALIATAAALAPRDATARATPDAHAAGTIRLWCRQRARMGSWPCRSGAARSRRHVLPEARNELFQLKSGVFDNCRTGPLPSHSRHRGGELVL